MLGFDNGDAMHAAAVYAYASGDTETAKAQEAIANAQKAGDAATPEQQAAAADGQGYMQERNKLEGQFTVDDKGKGPHNGNVVTSQELSKMARTMSNIDSGHSDVDIGGKVNDDMSDEDKQKVLALKAKKEADLEKLMQTGAGRQLLYKLSDNVYQRQNDEELHHKTTIGGTSFTGETAQAHAAPGYSEYDTLAAGYGGRGADVNASYTLGDDKQLFSALTKGLHMTQSSVQQGELGDNNYGTELDQRSHYWYGVQDGKVPKGAERMSREDAQVQGVGGYGTKLNGETITVNQYEKEARANASRRR